MKSKGRKVKGKKPIRQQPTENIQESKNLGGRPPKAFEVRLFETLCEMQCTSIEIAAAMGICRETLYNKVVDIYKSDSYSTVYDDLRANGNVSLRRAQWKSAVTDGNVTMQKFLGEQYLGQESVSRQKIEAEVKTEMSAKIEAEVRAKVEQEIQVQGSMTVETKIDISGLEIEDLEKLLEIQAKIKVVGANDPKSAE